MMLTVAGNLDSECDEEQVNTIITQNSRLSDIESQVYYNYANSPGSISRGIWQDVMDQIHDIAVPAKFSAIDSLIDMGCFPTARLMLDDIMALYIGSSFDSIRQRATIRIDDIRAAQ